MFMFDSEQKIVKYDTPVDIIKEFLKVRLPLYQKRKDHMLSKLGKEADILSAKARFILMIVKGELVVKKRRIADLLDELLRKGFKKMSDLRGADKEEAEEGNDAEQDDEDEDDNQDQKEGSKGSAVKTKEFEYLLGMPLQTLTYEKVQELKKLKEEKVAEFQKLQKTTIESLWLSDLDEFEAALDESDRLDKEAEEAEKKIVAKKRDGGGKLKASEKTVKKRKGDAASSSGANKAKSAKSS